MEQNNISKCIEVCDKKVDLSKWFISQSIFCQQKCKA